MPVVRELVTRLGYKIDDRDMKRYDSQLGGLTSSLGGLATAAIAAAAAMATIGGKMFLEKLVQTNIGFEKMKASLETVTGSAANADKAFEFIQNFASTTPFQLQEVAQAFIKLKALGIEPTEERLRSFGNTASAMGKDLDQYIEAVADASTGEFERLKEFGIKAKSEGDKVSFTFQGVTTTVKKNSEEITKYLTDIGQTKFAGAMEKQMNTLGGIISNIQDNISKFLVKVGESGFNDALRELLKVVRDLIGGGDDLAVTIGQGLGAALVKITEYIRWISDPATQAQFAKWAKVMRMVLDPFYRLYLVLDDIVTFFQGGDSLIERVWGSQAADRVRSIGKSIWKFLVKGFIAWKDALVELWPFYKRAFLSLLPALKDLWKAAKRLVEEFIAPMQDADENLLVNLVRAAIPFAKLMTVLLTKLLDLTVRWLTGFMRFVTWLLPILRVSWTTFEIFMRFSIDRIRQNWFFLNGFVRGQWDTTIAFMRGLLALFTGDIDGAVQNWSAAIRTFVNQLKSVGIDVGAVNGLVNDINTVRTNPLGAAGAIAPAGAGAPASQSSLASTLSSTVSNLIVNVTGSANMGPDQVGNVVRQGVGNALKDQLADASRNSAGAVT